MGSPASRTNCLGISPPKRLPSPPARTIAWICTRSRLRQRGQPGRHPPVSSVPDMIDAAARPPAQDRRPGPRADLARLATDPGAAPRPSRRDRVRSRPRPPPPQGDRRRHPAGRLGGRRRRLTLRFNVMQGPGCEPLAAGRWELVVPGPRAARGDPLRLSAMSPRPARRAPMSFAVGLRGTYNAVASVAARSGIFAIEVEHRPDGPGARRGGDPDPGRGRQARARRPGGHAGADRRLRASCSGACGSWPAATGGGSCSAPTRGPTSAATSSSCTTGWSRAASTASSSCSRCSSPASSSGARSATGCGCRGSSRAWTRSSSTTSSPSSTASTTPT